MTDDTTMAYLAGVVDSDGYIGVHRTKPKRWAPSYQPRVQVKQVETGAVDLFKETFGGHLYKQGPSARRGRPLWCWGVHSRACVEVLTALLPHLRIKGEQARNALTVCEINARPGRRSFTVPEVVPGEPMLTMAEAARRLGKGYGSVIQAVRQGTVPHTRTGPRRVAIPESFLSVWASRGSSPTRDPAVTAELEALFARAKELNRVGV